MKNYLNYMGFFDIIYKMSIYEKDFDWNVRSGKAVLNERRISEYVICG